MSISQFQYVRIIRQVLPYALEIFDILKENCTQPGTNYYQFNMIQVREMTSVKDELSEHIMLELVKELLQENYVIVSFGYPYANENKDVEDDSTVYINYKKKSTAVCRAQ